MQAFSCVQTWRYLNIHFAKTAAYESILGTYIVDMYLVFGSLYVAVHSFIGIKADGAVM